MTNERFYREKEYGEALDEKIKAPRHEHPNHNYEILDELARLLQPRLYQAANGDFDDDFDLKSYSEDEPEFESAADELAHKAKIYSLEKQVDYSKALDIICETDPDLAEGYKME